MTLVPCANLGGNHCDFCQSSPVFTVYPCSNFLHNGLPVFLGRTTGAWATCRKCAELVDGKKWSDLTERAYRKFLKRHGASRHEQLVVRAQFAELSRLFAAHMRAKGTSIVADYVQRYASRWQRLLLNRRRNSRRSSNTKMATEERSSPARSTLFDKMILLG